MAPSQSSGECKDPAQKGTERALPNQSWGQWLELRAVGGMRKKVASRGSWPSVGHAVEGNSTWKPALLQREQPGMSSGKSCMADFREVDRECWRGTLGAGREESVHWLRQGEGNLGLGFAGSEEEFAMASGWRSS